MRGQRSSHSPRLALAVGLVLVAGLLTACGEDDSSAGGGGDSGGSTKATIAIPIPTAAYALPQFALDQGLFEKHGVDAEVKVIPPPGVLNLLVSGRMNYGIFSGPVVATTRAQGADLVWISTYVSKPLVSFMSQPEVGDVSDLKGKSVAITTTGSLTSQMTEYILAQNGLSTDDVKLRPVGGQEQARNALLTGQVQAAMLASPDDALVEKEGMKRLVDLREEDISFPFAGLMTKAAFADENGELTANVLAAMNEAVAAWKDDPEAAKKVIAEMTKADAAFVDASYDDVTANLNDDTAPDEEAIAFELEQVAKMEPKAKELTVEDLMATGFEGSP